METTYVNIWISSLFFYIINSRLTFSIDFSTTRFDI